MLDRVHSQNGLLLVDWLFIASPSQTSQHARPCALPKRLLIGCLWPPLPRMLDLVHSQNGCLLHDYSLFVASLPKLPSMPDLVLTLCTPKTVVYGLFIACLLDSFYFSFYHSFLPQYISWHSARYKRRTGAHSLDGRWATAAAHRAHTASDARRPVLPRHGGVFSGR